MRKENSNLSAQGLWTYKYTPDCFKHSGGKERGETRGEWEKKKKEWENNNWGCIPSPINFGEFMFKQRDFFWTLKKR